MKTIVPQSLYNKMLAFNMDVSNYEPSRPIPHSDGPVDVKIIQPGTVKDTLVNFMHVLEDDKATEIIIDAVNKYGDKHIEVHHGLLPFLSRQYVISCLRMSAAQWFNSPTGRFTGTLDPIKTTMEAVGVHAVIGKLYIKDEWRDITLMSELSASIPREGDLLRRERHVITHEIREIRVARTPELTTYKFGADELTKSSFFQEHKLQRSRITKHVIAELKRGVMFRKRNRR